MADVSMAAKLAMMVSPGMPEVTNVYDATKGRYHDSVCETPAAPAYMPLPGTPSPIANLKDIK